MKSTYGRHWAFAAVVAIAYLIPCGTSAAASTLELFSWQDNGRRLPTENIVYFDADNPTLKLQLKLLTNQENRKFPATVVTLINSAGDIREFSANTHGEVTIDKISEGLYGVAAFNDRAHASTVFAFRQQETANSKTSGSLFEDVLGLDSAAADPAAAQLVMVVTMAEKLTPIVDQNLVNDIDVPVSAIDQNVVSQHPGLSPFDYRVQLGKGGVLRGQLITVMRPSSRYSAVKGTRITLTRNGIPVATATANALGQFQIGGVRPGFHGLVVTGRHGYASFAFEAMDTENLTQESNLTHQFISTRAQFDGTILPVALVPPNMIPAVLATLHEYLPDVSAAAPPPAANRRPPALEIADNDVAILDISDGFTTGLSGKNTQYNPLRNAGTRQAGGNSVGSSGGGLPALAGVSAAIAIPLAISGDDSPGIITSNAGF